MTKMTVRVILKSGVEFSIKCDKFTLTRNGFQQVTGYNIEGITENKPVYLDFEQVAAVVRVFSDEKPADRTAILEVQSADVAAVQHGRWTFGKDLPYSFGSINKNKYHLYCSECRKQAFNNSADNDCDFDMDTPFCLWCGAKMDGGVDNG